MYNNPNFYNYQTFQTKPSTLSNIKKLNLNDFLNGTQKTLNIINQAIPIFNQIKPLWENTKTIIKIAGAINSKDEKEQKIKMKEIKIKDSETSIKEKTKEKIKKEKDINSNEPIFFL